MFPLTLKFRPVADSTVLEPIVIHIKPTPTEAHQEKNPLICHVL